MSTLRTLFLAVGASLLLAAPATAQADPASVDGTITLPAGASLEGAAAWTVLIEDTSAADAPAVTIGAAAGEVTDPSLAEIPFAAVYDPTAIDESATYTLSARIVDGAGGLLFINDTAIPVITNGAPVEGVEVPVVAAASAPAGGPRVIELEADAALRFLQAGQQVTEIPVTPGETVLFRILNSAGFSHNFWIGTDEELMLPNGTTDVGLPDWDTGVQELEWVVPDDPSGLRFGCTVPGHYFLMQGDFTVTP